MSKLIAMIDGAIFREAENGRTIIYPWGLFGRAYTTACEAAKTRLRWLYALSLLLIPVAVVFTNHTSILMIIPVLAIYLVVNFGAMKLILANATDLEPMPRPESVSAFVAKFPKSFILMGLLGCVLFVLLGVLMIATGTTEERLAGVFAIIVFSAFGAGYGRLLFAKRRVEG